MAIRVPQCLPGTLLLRVTVQSTVSSTDGGGGGGGVTAAGGCAGAGVLLFDSNGQVVREPLTQF
jgi:hypothetical protein